jgi:hypothetical protein
MAVPVRRFAARWSAWTWIVTLVVIGLAVVVVGVVLSEAEKVEPENGLNRVSLIGAAMIVPMALLVCVVFAPLGYTVDAVGIVVNRIGPSVCIRHDEIAEIRRVATRDVGFSVRVFGSGGFFGYYGRFWSQRLGPHRMYATNGRDLVCIERVDGGKVVLSPYPADVFVAAVQEARG